VAQSGAAAAKVVELLSKAELTHEPIVAFADEEICSGCGQCEGQCTFDAIELIARPGNPAMGIPDRTVAKVNEILCQGCGACVVTCPSGAMSQKNFRMEQVYSMIESFL
jgi:heterodisulfide reductase subunit A